jgi:two-component system, NarL family, sensor kinase
MILRDITPQLEKEKEIRRLASMTQFNPNVILEIDASGQVTYCNDAATKIFQQLGVKEGPGIFLSDWENVVEELARNENRQLTRDVKIKDAVFNELIHFIPELEVIRLYAVDITARLRGEEALRQAKEELEKRVAAGTAELALAHQQLQQEKEERRQAEEALQESAQQLQALTYQLLNAEENERRQLSMTLHDDLGQDLIFLKYKIVPLAKKLQKDQQSKDSLNAVSNKLDEVIEKVRQISRYLSPTILEEVGFSAAVKHLFEEFCGHFNCACKISDKIEDIADSSSQPHFCHLLTAEGVDDLLSRQAQVNIYRLLQESLTNISKHSQATRVVVGIKKQDGYFSLVIEDNGAGFDVQKTMAADSLHHGMGLVSMQERVRMLGGTFNLESQEGSGTKISILIPLDKKG